MIRGEDFKRQGVNRFLLEVNGSERNKILDALAFKQRFDESMEMSGKQLDKSTTVISYDAWLKFNKYHSLIQSIGNALKTNGPRCSSCLGGGGSYWSSGADYCRECDSAYIPFEGLTRDELKNLELEVTY